MRQVPFTLDLPEDLFFGPKQRTKITVHKPIRPGDPEFKDVPTLRKHCFDTVMVSKGIRAPTHLDPAVMQIPGTRVPGIVPSVAPGIVHLLIWCMGSLLV